MMTPNMQGIIMAIGKSSSIYEKNGPEAAFFKVQPLSFHLSSLHFHSLTQTPFTFFNVHSFLSVYHAHSVQ